jgi:alpha-ketoglutarate-dependent taurine dioxygenase
MPIQIQPLHSKSFGAVVTGLNLGSLGSDEWHRVEHALHEYGVLVFPEQHLSEEAQVTALVFSRPCGL